MNPHRCEHPFETNRLNGTADFLPQWDVPALGQPITTALARDIDAVRARPDPDPARKIHLLRGPAGYGKTHLFGRVKHEQGDRVQFVFVSAVPDPRRTTESIRYQIVEALFHPARGGIAPIRRHLARLLRPSFTAYLDQLPGGLRAKCTELRQALDNDPGVVLDVIAPATELGPYHALAESVRQRLPNLPAGVVRAVMLSLSPAAEDARLWLRGEASQIAEDRLRNLQLTEDSPGPLDVLRTMGTLLGRIEVPLVLCLDQLDQIHVGSAPGFQELTAQLMGWLQQVPNLVVVLGCVDASWQQIQGEQNLTAFTGRIRTHLLPSLDPPAARELVIRRMQSWEEFDPARGDGWPFDLASVEKFVQRLPISPRGFIDRCKSAFDEWQARGKQALISLDPAATDETPLPELFLQEWEKQLAATRQGLKAPADYQDAELWAGIEQALRVAQLGQYVPAGVRFERFQRQALKPSPSDARPSAELELTAGSERFPVVVAVSKKDGGVAFGKWHEALAAATGAPVVGAVVVWPKAKLSVGKTAKAFTEYQQRVHQGVVRPFPLDDNEDTFAQLECLRMLIAEAEAGMLIPGGKALSADECRRLVVETKVLAELPLFEILFQNWPALEAARAKGAVAPATASAPAPSQPAAASAVSVLTSGPGPSPRTATQARPAAGSVAPPPKLATDPASPAPTGGQAWATTMLEKVVEKLRSRGQPVRALGTELGPTFVRLKVEPKDDTDFAKVKRQGDNLKLHLGLEVKPVIGNRAGFISIDVVRPDRQTVTLAPLLGDRPADLAGTASFPLGVDVAGHPQWLNLDEPATFHLLIAGTTGSGKSQLLKSMIASLCHQLAPEALKLILIDPKQVTFTFHGSSPYLDHPVVFDATEALPVMEACYQEMERRYTRLHQRGKEHVSELTGGDRVPRWVVVFDEFADLMLGDKATKKGLEVLLKRLGAKARAAGIHLVLGTQRPEASVVTPLLRANLPGRVSLQVASERESKLILDEPDAAHLLDKGDLLWRRGGNLVRLQAPLVGREELEQYLRLH